MRKGKARALHRYKNNGVYRGIQVPRSEIQRRIAQSLLATGHFRLPKIKQQTENNTDIIEL